jgi:hypothetical protein
VTASFARGAEGMEVSNSALSTQVRTVARGTAPVCRAATCPWRRTSKVGMAWTPNRCELCGEVSTFHLDELDLACQVAGELLERHQDILHAADGYLSGGALSGRRR